MIIPLIIIQLMVKFKRTLKINIKKKKKITYNASAAKEHSMLSIITSSFLFYHRIFVEIKSFMNHAQYMELFSAFVLKVLFQVKKKEPCLLLLSLQKKKNEIIKEFIMCSIHTQAQRDTLQNVSQSINMQETFKMRYVHFDKRKICSKKRKSYHFNRSFSLFIFLKKFPNMYS